MKPATYERARLIVLRILAERQAAVPTPIVDDARRQDRIQQRLEHSLYLLRMRKAERAAAHLQAEAARLATEVLARAVKAARGEAR